MNARGQASIFDGITFLLLASLASALIFAQVGGYGVEESKVIRSAYVLNYMQSVVKTLYSLDASTLKDVKNESISAYNDLFTSPETGQPDLRCSALDNYKGNVGVADLMKRDLTEAPPRLDDKFEDTDILGKTAARCAMKELMKPFAFAGYYYLVELLDARSSTTIPSAVATDGRKITNQDSLSGAHRFNDCGAVSASVKDVQAVAVPFQVVYSALDGTHTVNPYRLRFCIWPSGG